MKNKLLLTVALVLGSISMSNAQSEDAAKMAGFGGMHSCVKTDFNCGWFLSVLKDEKNRDDRGVFGAGYSISYDYLLNSRIGVGLDYITEYGKYNAHTFFVGPSFVYAKPFGSWTVSLSSGLGIGGIKYDTPRLGRVDVHNLTGIFAQTEVQKRFSKHFGIAAGFRVLALSHLVMDEFDEGEPDAPPVKGSATFRFTIGPRFYF